MRVRLVIWLVTTMAIRSENDKNYPKQARLNVFKPYFTWRDKDHKEKNGLLVSWMVFYSLIRTKQMLHLGLFGQMSAKLFISVPQKSFRSLSIVNWTSRSRKFSKLSDTWTVTCDNTVGVDLYIFKLFTIKVIISSCSRTPVYQKAN